MSSNLIYVCLLIALLVTVFIVRLYSAKVKGWMGEKAVAAILSSLDDLQYKVINNLVLDVHGKTVQIDHLIISDFGIFVIETKNYHNGSGCCKLHPEWRRTARHTLILAFEDNFCSGNFE